MRISEGSDDHSVSKLVHFSGLHLGNVPGRFPLEEEDLGTNKQPKVNMPLMINSCKFSANVDDSMPSHRIATVFHIRMLE